MRGKGHKGTKRVIRGGSWNNNARNVRAAYRNNNDPGTRNNNLGFRCARAHAGSRRVGTVPEPVVILSAFWRQTAIGFRCVSREKPRKLTGVACFY